jgi:hypothetical protein
MVFEWLIFWNNTSALFCFKLRKSAAEMHDLFETVGENKLLSGFLDANMGKLWL